ncbi:transposable element Tcb1 transposase [Elysia marginata]|uniref:Transposable element Tcb1 transposase n=1 Tax=Elysia marginata TaxID=1093978 RepID=A0AAV4FM11_9GAST|nr:transposable element Tcb1 transposase [Elysia marginata]
MRKVWQGMNLMGGCKGKKGKNCDEGDKGYANDLNKFYARFDCHDFVQEREECKSALFESLLHNRERIVIDESEVRKAMLGLKPNKAPGPGEVKPSMLKKCAEQLSSIMCEIFNMSLKESSSRQTRGRNNQRVSANTGRRCLSTSGLRARRPYIGPILTQRHRHQHTIRAQEHAAWDRIQWRSVVCSDESGFCIDHADGRERVWRRRGERYQANFVREHDWWSRASFDETSRCCCTGSPKGAHTLLAGACLDL